MYAPGFYGGHTANQDAIGGFDTVYVSHDAENLQFWLWLQDYTIRFYAAPKAEQVLSPPWYQVEAPQPFGNDPSQPMPNSPANRKKPGMKTYEVDFDNIEPPMSPGSPNFDKQSFLSGTTGNKSQAASVQDANTQMGLKWQSCTTDTL